MLKAVRKKHADPQKYVIYVLWLIGFSERSIASILMLRHKQIAGIVNRSEYKDRSSMTDEERQAHLMELADIRFENGVPLDGGKLDRIRWEVRPLRVQQLRGPTRRKL